MWSNIRESALYTCIVFIASVCDAHEVPEVTGPRNNSTKWEEVVESIANNNIPPQMVGGERPHPVFRENYDWEEQERVLKTIDRICASPEESWASLISHMTDDRYCVTVKSDRSATNLAVGDVCEIIIVSTLAAGYMSVLSAVDGLDVRFDVPAVAKTEDFPKWLNKKLNDGRSVRQLQIEMCEWALEFVNTSQALDNEVKTEVTLRLGEQIKLLRNGDRLPCGELLVLEVRVPYSKETAPKN